MRRCCARHDAGDDYFAVILDWKMTGERGKLPIVAMTANAFAEDVQLAKNAGMNEHVAAPLDMNKLNDVLGEWLG